MCIHPGPPHEGNTNVHGPHSPPGTAGTQGGRQDTDSDVGSTDSHAYQQLQYGAQGGGPVSFLTTDSQGYQRMNPAYGGGFDPGSEMDSVDSQGYQRVD